MLKMCLVQEKTVGWQKFLLAQIQTLQQHLHLLGTRFHHKLIVELHQALLVVNQQEFIR